MSESRAEPSIHLAILRGVVESGSVDAYLGSSIGIKQWIDDLISWGYVEHEGEYVEPEDFYYVDKLKPTEEGVRLYASAGLDEQPAGRWYFHSGSYQWPKGRGQ